MADMNSEDLPPLPDEAKALVQQRIEEEHGYLSWLNTRVETVESGRIVLTIPFDEKLTNSDGQTIHGGVAATLVDTAGGLVQRTSFQNPLDGGVATVNLNVNYLLPAEGDLRATGEIVRAGGSVGVSEMRVLSDTDEQSDPVEVVAAQGSYRLFRK
ncbi:MAG: hypothetical protein J07HR59_01334 [Halorubrum sp. J07HR59]|jgi:uncharacterized domain 1|nr:MAG: hypothetical protein J07HR59_01334 [Halorubrum sp. J07HR59]